MAEKRENPTWLKGLVAEGARRAGSINALAVQMGFSRPSVADWAKGASEPSTSSLVALLEYLGGDINRAMPDWKHDSTEVQPIINAGHVTGGVLSSSDITAERVSFSDLWRDSPMWAYADQAQPVIVVSVRGNSMAPTYPDGCKIALGKYNNRKLPQGSPCVFSTGHGESAERTFKLYRSATDGKIIGWPLNPEHAPIIFRGTPQIEFVVLGLCNPRPQPEVQPGEDLLLKLRGKRNG
jgi:SOS-response transcriptional repressor LexA